jgi:uncharacterized protein YprB with RNaseH-like and TPR domain
LYVKTLKEEKGSTEHDLLLNFCSRGIQAAKILCAHNGKEFDYPFLFRRLLANKIKVPDILNGIGKKPYEMNHLEDTVEMWSATQWKHKASLATLAEIFGIPSPKEKMDGSDVAPLYYSKQDLPWESVDQIAEYCNGDVVTLVKVYCAIKQLDVVITPENIIYA